MRPKKTYQVLDLKHPDKHHILRRVAKEISFPLSEDDQNDIQTVEHQFDNETNMAGLAAPQIGISKQIIVFAIPDDPELKKWRLDLTQSMPKTIWINPKYFPIGTEKHEDYEGCFSVNDLAGPVLRFRKIRYTAFDVKGNFLEGIAEGYLARVIQHEVDHVQGKLFVDYVDPKDRLSISEYRERRRKALEQ